MTDIILSPRAWRAMAWRTMSPIVSLWSKMNPTRDTVGLLPIPNGHNSVDYYRVS